MAYGFVYVLSNESMPGIYKIGFTARHPRERMSELSAATACPTPFDLMAFFGTDNPQQVERDFHLALANFRVNSSREFFKAPLDWIQDLIREYANPQDDACYTGLIDFEVNHSKFLERKEWPVKYFFQQCADPIYWPEKIQGFD